MTESPGDESSPYPPFDEVTSKRFGRRVQRWIRFRDEVLSRDPESIVDSATAAAILDVRAEDLPVEMDEGRLGFVEIEGQRVIRVADLCAAYDAEVRRLEEAAKGFTQLNGQFGWDE